MPIKMGDETLWVETVPNSSKETGNSLMIPLNAEGGDGGALMQQQQQAVSNAPPLSTSVASNMETKDEFEPPQQSIVPPRQTPNRKAR